MKANPQTLLAALVVGAALSSCVTTPPTTAMLTYSTTPAGATLFEGDKALGVEPVTRTYSSNGKPGDIRTPDVKAVWPSGATETYYTLLPVGSDRNATIERPADAPNAQVDLDNAKTILATRQREAERLKASQKSDIARASDRCKAQQSGQSLAVTDDCQ